MPLPLSACCACRMVDELGALLLPGGEVSLLDVSAALSRADALVEDCDDVLVAANAAVLESTNAASVILRMSMCFSFRGWNFSTARMRARARDAMCPLAHRRSAHRDARRGLAVLWPIGD